jgi:tetratricopeptide (TPR) repeat protein
MFYGSGELGSMAGYLKGSSEYVSGGCGNSAVRLFALSLLIVSLLLSSACQVKKPPPPAPSAPPVEEEIEEEVEDPQASEVYQLLLRANQAMVRDRLMKPDGDNAWFWFREVLHLQPDNAEAKAGIARMAERYIELAVEAYRSGNHSQAELMLSRAKMLGADPASVGAVKLRMQKGQLFAPNEFSLDATALAERNAAILQRVNEIARLVKQKNSRIIIVAGNDDDGRWIYQQLREQLSGYTLRGDIQRGKIPHVVLLDW